MYWKLAWREIRLRPGRAGLTLASVVIAVAGVVAVTFATQTTRRAFDEIYQTIAGRAALEISADVGESFDESLLDAVSAVPGVEAAVPLIQRRTVMYVGRKGTQLNVLGIDPKLDRFVRDYELESGKSLAEASGVMLNTDVARNLGIKLNDRVDLLTRRGMVKTQVVGLYKLRGTVVTGQGAVLLMRLPAAQAAFKAPKKLDAIQVALVPGTDEASVQAEIAKLLPPGVTVHPPAARSSMAIETSLSTEQGLSMARAFSLLVAVFIIANTFLISVTQLRRQFGIMRAIGALRRQIARLVLVQALILGAAGTALGCLLGLVVANYLVRAMGALYSTTLPPIELTATPFLLAAVFGLGVSVVGALLPARKAAHLSPVEAIHAELPVAIEGVARWLVVTGALLVVICGSVLAASITGRIPMGAAVWASVALLIGIVLMLPLGLYPLSRAAAMILKPWMRVETRLACRQLLRHRSRTTLTVGVVFVAISTGIGLANSVIDNVQDVRNWYRKTIVADFFVRAMNPDMATGQAADLPDALDAEIRQAPGITGIEAVRFVSAKAAGEQVIMVVRGFADATLHDFDLVSGDAQTIRDRLRAGETVIGSVLAERAGLKVADSISLQTEQGEQPFRIAGVTNDYQAGGLTMYVEREVAQRLLDVGGVDAYVIKADPAKRQEVQDALHKLTEQNGLMLQSFSDIQQKIEGMMAGVVAGLWGMVVLGLIVAAFGVANTLMVTVLEQTREFGLLRAIAMTRSQIRRTILAQSLIMGLLALVPGVAAGIGVAYLIHLATLPVIGHAVRFVPHPTLIGGGLILGFVVVTFAAWLPAERAARLELTEALRME